MARVDPKTALYEVPGSLMAECGFRTGGVRGNAYRCDDPNTILVPLTELRVPAGRALDPERLKRILRAVAAHDPLPAVPVFRRTDAVVVLDGMHRFAVASALGFKSLPCLELSLDEAGDGYRYPDGQL